MNDANVIKRQKDQENINAGDARISCEEDTVLNMVVEPKAKDNLELQHNGKGRIEIEEMQVDDLESICQNRLKHNVSSTGAKTTKLRRTLPPINHYL